MGSATNILDERLDEEDDGPFVCFQCVGEPVLRGEIETQGVVRPCAYCEDERRAMSLEWLAERVDPVYRAVVGVADEVPHVTAHDNVHWIPEGNGPGEIMSELVQAADSRLGDDLIETLGEKHSWEIFDGDFDWYDSTEEIYDLRVPADPRFYDAWNAFCEAIKHGRRFFDEGAVERLDEILGPVLAGEASQFGIAVRTIGPESEDRFLYRARPANHEFDRRAIYQAPIAQLGAPPKAVCTAGRMNAAGIPVFYASFDVRTCVAEVRTPVGGAAVVGQFEIIRPLRLLDLTQLETVQNALSFFHPDFAAAHAYGQFVGAFHREIKRPVLKDAEALEYLPTQAVAEYLWTRGEKRVDGLIFGSSQVTGGRPNIVLFPGAFNIEGAATEVAQQIRHSYVGGGNPDDEEPPEEHVSVVLDGRPPSAADAAEAALDALEDSPFFIDPDRPPPPPPPTLRFTGKLIRAQVRAIEVVVDETPVSFHTYDPDPPF
jgi:hypothetical protein